MRRCGSSGVSDSWKMRVKRSSDQSLFQNLCPHDSLFNNRKPASFFLSFTDAPIGLGCEPVRLTLKTTEPSSYLKVNHIAKNRNTYAKRQREQEKRQRADDKRRKRENKITDTLAGKPSLQVSSDVDSQLISGNSVESLETGLSE